MKRLFLALVGLLLIVASCGDDSTAETSTLATTTTTAAVNTSTTSGGTTTTTAAITTTQAPGLLVEVAVHTDGVVLIVDSLEVEPGVRVSIAAGSLVRFVTSGEVAEEVHVHVYDVSVDVTPGQEGTLEFVADIPGIIEVELEGAGTLLLELEVS